MFVDVYKKASLQADSTRTIEYRVFAEITGDLQKANKADTATQERIKALFRNSQLWSTLQADLMLPGNQMGNELKAGLISLSIWVAKFTGSAMNNKADLEPLISVNRQIMEGLMMAEKNARQPVMQKPEREAVRLSA